MRCRQVDTDDTRTTPAGDALICRTVAAVHQGADGYRLCVFLGEVDLATLDEAEEIVSNLRLRPPSSPLPPTRRTHASCTPSVARNFTFYSWRGVAQADGPPSKHGRKYRAQIRPTRSRSTAWSGGPIHMAMRSAKRCSPKPIRS